MSTSSLHRLKERGGGGGGGTKTTAISAASASATTRPFKSVTPLSEKSSSGKENLQRCASRPRASSVTRSKPTMLSMPRIDKPSAINGAAHEARARWSTSSVGPRGRCPSPHECTRVLSDMKKGGVGSGSRVSIDRSVVEKRVGVNKKNTENGRRVSEKFDKNGVFVHDLKFVDNKKLGSRVVRNVDGHSVCSSSIEVRLNDRIDSGNKGRVLEKSDKNGIFVSDLKFVENKKVGSRVVRNPDGHSVCSSSIEVRLNDRIDSGNKGRVLEKLKVRTVDKMANLLGLDELRLNGDTDSKNKNSVSYSTELKSCDESTLIGNVELSEKNGRISAEAPMISLAGNNNVDLSEKDHAFGEMKVRANSEMSDKLTSKGSRLMGRSSGLKDKTVTEEGKDGTSSAKRYPSKLHEKLAFLEGKVKKIASDIKQTKEMLDLNNPDASKVILSDIKEKISGIEKEMGNVVSVGGANTGLLKDDGNDEGKVIECSKQVERRVGDGRKSVKGLSGQELEARLFPHQKLLKDRTCLNPSSEMSQIDESREGESIQNQKSQDKSVIPIDETIALEFLESLKNEQSAIPIEDKNDDTEKSEGSAHESNSASLIACQNNFDFLLTANEKLEEFDEQENTSRMMIEEEDDNSCAYMLNEIGHKNSTGGWFVLEGEAVLLAHDDGSCSYYDITNCEGKAEYKPPAGISPNMWRDCWIVRAPSADGCAGRYVVAASAGNSFEAGFCSWDFYTKDVRAFHVEDGAASVRTALADLPNNTMYRRNALFSTSSPENLQWFYRPCGPLVVSTASCQRSVKVYDIRDGEHVMRWALQKPVAAMEYSSPLQWRNKGKVVVAEAETISMWDVSSLSAQPLLSISSCNRKISALHVNNTDAELGGGVRQRVSSSEEGNDGVFCTADSINVLDFRQSSGIGLKIPKVGVDVQSTFSRGDSVLLGCTSLKSTGKKQFASQIQQFSLRKQGLLSAYVLPDSNAHSHHKAITQVWGNSNLVMGVSGLGLCVYDSLKDEGSLPYTMDSAQMNNVKDVIGPDDLYYPSFDYLASRVLLISRDRPAQWRYMS